MGRILAFLILVLMLDMNSTARAQNRPQAPVFTVILNGSAQTVSGTVAPCTPLFVRFEHPDPHVTRVRMRYPYNHAMYMLFPLHQDIRLQLHEDFMNKGEWSLSDFIAEDESGLRYGEMTLTFQPLDPDNKLTCDVYPNT